MNKYLVVKVSNMCVVGFVRFFFFTLKDRSELHKFELTTKQKKNVMINLTLNKKRF